MDGVVFSKAVFLSLSIEKMSAEKKTAQNYSNNCELLSHAQLQAKEQNKKPLLFLFPSHHPHVRTRIRKKTHVRGRCGTEKRVTTVGKKKKRSGRGGQNVEPNPSIVLVCGSRDGLRRKLSISRGRAPHRVAWAKKKNPICNEISPANRLRRGGAPSRPLVSHLLQRPTTRLLSLCLAEPGARV